MVPTSTPVPLPSSFSSRQVELPSVSKSCRTAEQRPRIHTKTVVCLPPVNGPNCIIPRGETRSKLVENGMIAKMSFESIWNETQIAAEIYALLHHLFEGEGSNEIFSFQHLR